VLGRLDFDGRDSTTDSRSPPADELSRIVRQQRIEPDPQVAQDLGADAVVALIRP
jgi:hypothetical protein